MVRVSTPGGAVISMKIAPMAQTRPTAVSQRSYLYLLNVIYVCVLCRLSVGLLYFIMLCSVFSCMHPVCKPKLLSLVVLVEKKLYLISLFLTLMFTPSKGRIPLFQQAANLVADLRERVGSRSKACRKQVASQLQTCFKPASNKIDVSGHEETKTLHMG